jgi:seryl-tRNA synthetase
MLRSRPHALPSLRRISSPSPSFLSLTRSLSSSCIPPQPKQPTKEPLSSTLPPPRLDYRPLLNRTALQGLIFNSNFRNSTLPESHFHTASKLASRRTSLNERIVSLRTARNAISTRLKERDPTASVDEAKRIKAELLALEPELQSVEKELLKLVVVMPNDTHGEVPIGPEENAVELERIGPEELIEHDTNRDHLIVGRELGIVDFESAAQVSGAGFYYLKGAGVILEQAIQSYALSIAVKHGFEPVACPDVVRTDMAARCGFVPRDSDGSSQSYHIASSSSSSDESSSMPLSLAGTAEIPLAGSFFNKLFPQDSLPKRLVGTGHAFRTEAGNGKEVRGLYRVHQFSKVELFVACEEGQSEREMENLRDLQREVVQGLGLSVRVLDMPSEELGASAHRKYDMEAWMPGRGSWGEASIISQSLFKSSAIPLAFFDFVASFLSLSLSQKRKSEF